MDSGWLEGVVFAGRALHNNRKGTWCSGWERKCLRCENEVANRLTRKWGGKMGTIPGRFPCNRVIGNLPSCGIIWPLCPQFFILKGVNHERGLESHFWLSHLSRSCLFGLYIVGFLCILEGNKYFHCIGPRQGPPWQRRKRQVYLF